MCVPAFFLLNKDAMEEKRDTVGKVATDLLASDTPDHSPEEQMRENLVDYEKNMEECIERGKKEFDGDFYVVVETKKERLMNNVLRNFFFNRLSCPTPTWDQTVYKFNRKDDHIEFLWVVPAKDICSFFMKNMLQIPKEQAELLRYVMDFEDGTLLTKAKMLNGEKEDSLELAKE